MTHSRGEAVTQSGTTLVFFLRLSSYPLPLAQAVLPLIGHQALPYPPLLHGLGRRGNISRFGRDAGLPSRSGPCLPVYLARLAFVTADGGLPLGFENLTAAFGSIGARAWPLPT